jgi:hypothetical protein
VRRKRKASAILKARALRILRQAKRWMRASSGIPKPLI